MHKLITLSIIVLFSANVHAQETHFIKLVNPTKANNPVASSRQFITDSTCNTCIEKQKYK